MPVKFSTLALSERSSAQPSQLTDVLSNLKRPVTYTADWILFPSLWPKTTWAEPVNRLGYGRNVRSSDLEYGGSAVCGGRKT